MENSFKVGDTVSNIIMKTVDGNVNLKTGKVAGIVLKVDGLSFGGRSGDHNYIILTNDEIDRNRISSRIAVSVNVSGGKYKKSRKTRKNHSRRR